MERVPLKLYLANYRGILDRVVGRDDIAFEYAFALRLKMLHWSDVPHRLVAQQRLTTRRD